MQKFLKLESPCLKFVDATSLLIQEARKLTSGNKIMCVSLIWLLQESYCLPPSRIMKYQAVLVKQEDVELKVTSILNPDLFLNVSTEEREIEHNYLQTIE